MLKRISNTRIIFYCAALSVCVILSCTQYQASSEGKLVFENLSDVSMKISGAIINGKKQGLWINYDDRGKVSSYQIYINDSLTGESMGYFSDGVISSKGQLKNGERDGNWVLYYDRDKIAEKGAYQMGRKIGIWEYYIEEGKLDKKIKYIKNGKQKVLEDNHLMPPVPNH